MTQKAIKTPPQAKRPTPAAAASGARVAAYVLLVAAAALYGWLLLRTAWLCDDSYITFRTVGNFVSGYGLTWNIDERVQAYTHPLWMFLLSGLFCLTANVYYSAIFGSIALSLAAVLVYAFGIARTVWQGLLGLAILVFSKAFIDFSTSGLESPLSYLLLSLFLLVYLRQETMTPRRLLQLALLAGLLVLNRMDLLLLVAPALGYAFWQNRGLKAIGLLLLGFAPFVAWEIFSVIYYGFPFPNTAYAKLNTGMPAGQLIHQGWYYVLNSLGSDRVTLPAIVCAILAVAIRRQARPLTLAIGIVLYLLYTIKIGGDFMSGRFFAIPLFASVAILGTLDLPAWPARLGWCAGVLGAICLGLSSPNPSILTGATYGRIGDGLVDPHGIADERGWYYIFTGLLRSSDYQKLAHDALHYAKIAREGSQKVLVSKNTIGLFGYHVGPTIHIIDLFALADPLLARLPSKPDPKWRIGHFERDLPAGYAESLKSGRNEIVDPHVHDLYDQVLLATRGPLFTRQRWAAIWRLNVTGVTGP